MNQESRKAKQRLTRSVTGNSKFEKAGVEDRGRMKKGKDKRDRGRTSGVDRGYRGQWFRKCERRARENELRAHAKREGEREKKRNTLKLTITGYAHVDAASGV
jgi:hypothetical protein